MAWLTSAGSIVLGACCSICIVMQFTAANPKASEPGSYSSPLRSVIDLVAGVRLVAEVVDLGEDRADADGAVPLVLHRLEELRDGVGDLVAVGRPLRVEVEVHGRLHDGWADRGWARP